MPNATRYLISFCVFTISLHLRIIALRLYRAQEVRNGIDVVRLPHIGQSVLGCLPIAPAACNALVEQRHNTGVRFEAYRPSETLFELYLHIRHGNGSDEILQRAVLLLLFVADGVGCSKRQSWDDERRDGVAGEIEALPCRACSQQYAAIAFFELL